jgi:NAD-dependent DNA ligase
MKMRVNAGLSQHRKHLLQLEEAYAAGHPLEADEVYDSLKEQYKRELKDANVRSKQAWQLEVGVGAPLDASSPLVKVQHSPARGGRLLSLAAAHSEDEVRAWWVRNIDAYSSAKKVAANDVKVVVEPKVDGLTVRASYENGSCVEVRCSTDCGAALCSAQQCCLICCRWGTLLPGTTL